MQKNENNVFSSELLNILDQKKKEDKIGEVCRRLIDGEEKNIDPLKEIPSAKMKLYGFSGVFESSYFDTEEQLIDYVKKHDVLYGNVCIIEYLGNVAGRSDVIRRTNRDGKQLLFTVLDRDSFGIYNDERSIYKGEFVWSYNYGSYALDAEYSAFRDRGIVFKNDIYAKAKEENKRILKAR